MAWRRHPRQWALVLFASRAALRSPGRFQKGGVSKPGREFQMAEEAAEDHEGDLDAFLDKFRGPQRYEGAFSPDSWEQEFDKIPMFMKKAPSEIDSEQHPDLACLQSIIFDEEQTPEAQATTYKNEGNDYFKEKDYKKAVISYTEGLKKKCSDQDLNAVLLTNRAAAQFYLGNVPLHSVYQKRYQDGRLSIHPSCVSVINCICLYLKRYLLKKMSIQPFSAMTIQRRINRLAQLDLRLQSNCRSALNDAIAARKLKPDHLKAIVRGALCHLELRHFHEALTWCEEGLKIDPKEKKLLETRTKADRLKRTEERDLRKAKVQEKKELSQKEALLKAIRDRNIKLSKDDSRISTELAEMSLDGLSSENITGAKVSLDENGCLIWPVLFLYPEHGQTDFVAAFHEESRFIDHLMVMFEELPPWDVEEKYIPSELELYYEDEERAEIYQVDTQATLLEALQQQRYFVKTGTPTFLVLVKLSPFSKNYFFGKKVHRLK